MLPIYFSIADGSWADMRELDALRALASSIPRSHSELGVASSCRAEVDCGALPTEQLQQGFSIELSSRFAGNLSERNPFHVVSGALTKAAVRGE